MAGRGSVALNGATLAVFGTGSVSGLVHSLLMEIRIYFGKNKASVGVEKKFSNSNTEVSIHAPSVDATSMLTACVCDGGGAAL